MLNQYRPPLLNALLSGAAELRAAYEASNKQRGRKSNSQRLLLADLSDAMVASFRNVTPTSITANYATICLAGWYMALEETVPAFSPGRVWNGGSTFGRPLPGILCLSPQNPLKDDARFVYMQKALEHIRGIPALKNNTEMLTLMRNALKKVYNRNVEGNQILLEGPPTLFAISQQLRGLKGEYTAQKWKENPERVGWIDFLQFMNQSVEELIRGATRFEGALSPEELLRCEQACQYFIAVILAAALSIDNEYSRVPQAIWSPFHSKLYKILMNILNVQHLSSYSIDDKLSLLRQALAYLKTDAVQSKAAAIYTVQDLNIYVSKIAGMINALEALKNKDSIPVAAAKTGLQSGLVFVGSRITAETATKYIGSTVVPQVLGAAVLPALGVPTALVYYASYLIMATSLVPGLLPKVKELASDWVMSWMLNKLTNGIVDTTVGTVDRFFTSETDCLSAKLRRCDKEDRRFLLSWMNAYLNADSDIVPESMKQHIRRFLYGQDQKPEAAKIEEITSEMMASAGARIPMFTNR